MVRFLRCLVSAYEYDVGGLPSHLMRPCKRSSFKKSVPFPLASACFEARETRAHGLDARLQLRVGALP